MEFGLMFIVYGVVIVAVTGPINTLVHELTHALTALAAGATDATINLGFRDHKLDTRFWKLRFKVAPLSSYSGFFTTEQFPPGKWVRIAVSAAGPLSSMVMIAVWFGVSRLIGEHGQWLRVICVHAMLGAAIQALVTAIPMTYGRFFGGYAGMKSDGLRVLEALRDEDPGR